MAITPPPPPVLSPPEVLVQVSSPGGRASLAPAGGQRFLDTNPRLVGVRQQAPYHRLRVRVLATPQGARGSSSPGCRLVYGQLGQVNDLTSSVPYAGDGTYRLAVTVADAANDRGTAPEVVPDCNGPTTEVSYRVDTRLRLRKSGRLVQNDEKPALVPLRVTRIADGSRVEAELKCVRDPRPAKGGGLTGSRVALGYLGRRAEVNGFITAGRWACVARLPAFRPGLRSGEWSAPTPVQVVR